MAHAVLLTAAIRPDPRFRVALADADRRLGQYVASLRAWLSFAEDTGAVVIVVETSQSADILSSAGLVESGRLEIVEWSPAASAVERGKGAVEAGAIDHVVGLLADRRVTTLTKVTGRLRLANPRAVLSELAPNSAMVRRTLDRRFADTRLIHAALDVWGNVLGEMANEVDEADRVYLEHVVALRLIRAEYERGTAVLRFPQRPRFLGQSGTSGANYGGAGSGIRARVMQRLEDVVQRLAAKQI